VGNWFFFGWCSKNQRHWKGYDHDVKAVEVFPERKIWVYWGWMLLKEFIHFWSYLTDINIQQHHLMLKQASWRDFPVIREEVMEILQWSCWGLERHPNGWQKTHGQPAIPYSSLGKEINVFVARLKGQMELLEQVPCCKVWWCHGNMTPIHVSLSKYWLEWFRFHFVDAILGSGEKATPTQMSITIIWQQFLMG